MEGSFIDHGHLDIQEEVETLTQEGFTRTEQLCPEQQNFLRLDFPVYTDDRLRFLDRSTEIGRQVSQSLVQAEFDDDCATDEDMKANADGMIQRELSKAVDRYLVCKRQGPAQLKNYIKNLEAETRFQEMSVWDDGDLAQ
mmetsp:Transcript_13231/g.22450  ORF Transcript_13231/g.22450 Transcript_13231/m.22450 type:complete len:140 (-) Transcript_13231:32-451(-)